MPKTYCMRMWLRMFSDIQKRKHVTWLSGRRLVGWGWMGLVWWRHGVEVLTANRLVCCSATDARHAVARLAQCKYRMASHAPASPHAAASIASQIT